MPLQSLIDNMPAWFTQGGPVMWPLLLFSILVLTITLERGFFWLCLKMRPRQKRLQTILQHLQQEDKESAQELLANSSDPLMRVLRTGLQAPTSQLTNTMELTARQELDAMVSGQNILDTIITLAPMLGILGTVLGIIDSFQMLSSAGAEEPAVVVGGIAEALITTAAGLCVAIFALCPFNLFRRWQQQQALQIEAASTQIEVLLGVANEAVIPIGEPDQVAL